MSQERDKREAERDGINSLVELKPPDHEHSKHVRRRRAWSHRRLRPGVTGAVYTGTPTR